MVDVSVIIVNYNTPELTRACVSSVLAHTVGCQYEILVVDNASTLGDISSLGIADARVQYLPQIENLGFAKGNNAGFFRANGNFILLLNSDTELIDDAVSRAWEVLVANPKVGALSVAMQYPDGTPQHPPGSFPSIGNEFLMLTRLEKFLPHTGKVRLHYDPLMNTTQTYYPDWIWGAFWMAPRTAIAAMPGGRLPEDFFMYYEDVLWAWILRKKLGLEVCYAPVATVIHHMAGSGNKTQSEEEKYRKRIFPSEWAFLKKYRGWGYAHILLALRILRLLSMGSEWHRKRAMFYAGQLFQ